MFGIISAKPLQVLRRNFHTTIWNSRRCETPSPAIPNLGHEGGHKIYKSLSLFLALPIIIGLSVMHYMKPYDPCDRPPYIEHEYMRRLTKRWFWGDGVKSAFHNPHRNALPGIGYEDEQDLPDKDKKEK